MLIRNVALFFLLVLFPFRGRTQSPVVDASPLRARANAARDAGDIPQAITLYREAVTADPGWADGWWFLGNLEYRLDHFEPARQALSQFIELSPKAVAAYALRGLCEYGAGSYPESLGDIQHALAMGAASQPRNAQILLYHEALLLTRLGRFEEAIAKYTAFAKQGIANRDLAIGLGLAGLRMPLLPESASAADLQVAEAAGNAALTTLSGDAPAGVAAFHRLLTDYPSVGYVHYFCGYLLLNIDLDQAIQELQAEVATAPAGALGNTMLAWALEFRGDYAQALPVARKAVQVDARLSMNQLVLGRALLETGDAKGAVEHLDGALSSDGANLEAHISLAKAYSELGRKDEARQERLLCLKLSDKKTADHVND